MGHVKDAARAQEFDENSRYRKHVIGDDAGSKHVARGYGSNVEAAQDALFPKHDESGAESPEAAHREDSGVEEEKSEGHDHAEKQKHFIAQRELNAHTRQGGEVCQSRNLLPVISIKTSSSEGEAISRLTSSLSWASRCLTRETIV